MYPLPDSMILMDQMIVMEDVAVQLEDLKKAGLPACPEDARKMINLLDRNHDGRVSFEEFQRYLCLLPAAQVPPKADFLPPNITYTDTS